MGLSKHRRSGERLKPPDKTLLDLETESQLPDSYFHFSLPKSALERMLLLPSRQGPQESLMLFVFRAGLPKRQGFTALNAVCLVGNLTLNKFCRHFIKARWRWLALENRGLLRPSIILNSSQFDTIIYISETKLLLDAP